LIHHWQAGVRAFPGAGAVNGASPAAAGCAARRRRRGPDGSRRAELKRLAGLVQCQAGNGAGQPDWFAGKPAGRREISGRDMRQAVADAIGLRRILLVPVPAGGADDGQRLIPERLGAGQAWRRD